MTTKKYLQQLRTLNIKIRQREEQIAELRSKAMSSGSLSCNDDRVQTSVSGDKLSETVSRYVDMQAEISRLIEYYVAKKNEIITAIQRLDDPRYVSILYKRYVDFESFEQIACDLHYNYTWTCELHGQALQALERTETTRKRNML